MVQAEGALLFQNIDTLQGCAAVECRVEQGSELICLAQVQGQQAGAFGEGLVLYIAHTGRDGDVAQAGALPEGTGCDALETVGQDNFG